MKKNLLSVFSAGLMIALLAAFNFAQESRRTVSEVSSLYVISAKAGGVNFVEGKVAVTRKVGKSGYLLKGDTLEIGDKVSTGADGKAEILLNPGSFVRLAENSSFEFATTSLEDLQLKLDGGSAIFEVITDNQFSVAVNTPKAKFYIVKTGVYRVDVLSDGAGKIEVWKGRAQISGANPAEIKSGRQAIASGEQVTVAKFDRNEKDALEIFSKSRAKELSKINARLQSRDVRTSLMSSFYRTRWSLYDSYGLWIYSPSSGSYCFLPFGYGWSSPYGYNYPRDIWYYNLPPVIYNSPPPTQTVSPRVETGATLSDRVRNPRVNRESEQPNKVVPPFERIQRDIGRMPSERQDRQVDASPFPVGIPSSQQPPSSPPPMVVTPTGPPSKRGDN